jgi:hypothetical protein
VVEYGNELFVGKSAMVNDENMQQAWQMQVHSNVIQDADNLTAISEPIV